MEKKIYRIKNTTYRDYDASDIEEQDALISIMRDLARPFGFMVLTYSLRSGNLSTLITTLHHGNLLNKLQEDSKQQVSSDDESTLLEQLRPLFSQAQLAKLQTNLSALRKRGEDTTPLLKQYTKNIGDPVKLAEAINEAFTCWIQKNRPHIYEEFEDEICHPLITHQAITDTVGLQDTAAAMDQEAVLHDEADAPKKYWCGYADALRGDNQALEGLRQLIGDSVSGVKEAQKLGYDTWLEQINFSTTTPKPESTQLTTPPPELLIPGSLLDEPTIELPQISTLESSPSAVITTAPSQQRGAQLTLLVIVLIALGVGITYVFKQNQPDNPTISTVGPKPPSTKETPPQLLTPEEQAKAKKLKQTMRLLYGPIPELLAKAFTESRSTEKRLSMSRQWETTAKRYSSYSEQALTYTPTNLTSTGIASSSGILYQRFKVKFVDGSSRMLCVVATADGLKVDWDCYARYCTAPWPQIKNGTAKSATVRVLAKQSYHYQAAYQDKEQWMSCELTSPDFDGSLYAYALRGADAAKLLAEFLPTPESNVTERVTLRISSSEGGHKRDQFTIDRVRAFSWVLGDKDVEETWGSPQGDQARDENEFQPLIPLKSD